MFLLILDHLDLATCCALREEFRRIQDSPPDQAWNCFAVIDVGEITHRIDANQSVAAGDTFEMRIRPALEAMVDACAVGCGDSKQQPVTPWLVILVPEQVNTRYGDATGAERLAFWLRRHPEQFCAHVDGRSWKGTVGELMELVEKRDASIAVEPWPEATVLEIDTPRLALTVPTKEHLQGYYDDIIGTDMFVNLLWNGPSCVEDLMGYWVRARQSHARGPEHTIEFAIIHKESNRMIGGASFRQKTGDPTRAEVGYTFAPKYQRQGFGTEAIGALVEFGFTKRNARRIDAEVFIGNTGSRRLLEKLGFSLEGTLRQVQRKQGRSVDCWMFAMTSDDWLMERRLGAGVQRV